ncbi:DNA mismatch repair protein MSH3 [Coprinopsis marcescibilis]|uniref:DNA mismatch repair protein MSH3 n=1 Tax=Coprinopsis marcescibilis TaxID=230819 RepID=A0A5C3L318_COPMA|nr:DNA mismatch repair protein MSH3 [Coprinopsis marcescibilis]
MSHNKQATISAFFGSGSPTKRSTKRPSDIIDLTAEEAATPPRKRSKNQSSRASPYFLGASSSSGTLPPRAGITEEYGYSAEKPTENKPRTAAQQKRHEEFKQRLLLDSTLFLPNGVTTEKETLEQDHGAGAEANDMDTEPESEVETPDEQFRKLQEMFTNKGKKVTKKSTTAIAKKAVEIGPSGKPYTPLELQVLELKKDNPGTLLMVEVGYKYKFYNEDAKTAAKELGMVAYNDRNFFVASIPTHRRDVYLKKLLSQGYRVGIVNQIETAALKKVGDNKSGPFERKLTHLYTDATYIDELNSVDDLERYAPPPVLCIVEECKENRTENASFGIITICPTTGDVVWDDFDDKAMRIELETRLSHLQPAEILQQRDGLSGATANMLSSFSGTSTTGNKIRSEFFDQLMSYTDAFEYVSGFYTDKSKYGAASEQFRSGQLMAEVTAFPKRVVVALAQSIKHLSAFGIADAFLETKFFTKFSTRAHMLLAANTLTNLEIYRNETNGSVQGSLIWILDRTKTKFGARLLRNWVGRPLVDKRILQERVDAVQEIIESPSDKLLTVRQILKGLPDLAKGLSRIQYSQCTPQELAILLPAFNKIGLAFEADEFKESSDVGFQSDILNEVIFALPKIKEPVQKLLNDIDLRKATEGDKARLWNSFEKYPDIVDADCGLQMVQHELNEELRAVRRQLRLYSLDWKSYGVDDYLVEVKKKDKRPIPDTWILNSSTRTSERYYTPNVIERIKEQKQYQELLDVAASAAFQSFLQEIANNYYGILRDAVNKLAIIDCLCSLAHIALRDDYVRPEFVEDDVLEIVEGRHPMTEELRSDPYIPNSVYMGDNKPRSKIITGPNMGGKSSCVRTIALIVIMAQIGSYVPATSVRMRLMDSVLTRMGASDDIIRGRSTFMVEMSETKEILEAATDKSLIILDELGRGTSTFDGMAIADAVLRYLVEQKRCKTLFITHYPMVATRLQKRYPTDLENLHMEHTTKVQIDGTRTITFLYKLTSGLAPESFGIECGRLAGLPEKILRIASKRSDQMRNEVNKRIERNRVQKAVQMITRLSQGKGPESAATELASVAQALLQPVDDLPQT